MQITDQDLLAKIGALTVEGDALRTMLQTAQAEIASLRAHIERLDEPDLTPSDQCEGQVLG